MVKVNTHPSDRPIYSEALKPFVRKEQSRWAVIFGFLLVYKRMVLALIWGGQTWEMYEREEDNLIRGRSIDHFEFLPSIQLVIPVKPV